MIQQNIRVLCDFKDYWRSSPIVKHLPTGNMMFLANVAFHSPKGTAVERTNVRVIMNGLDEGQIDIDERGDLMVNQFHLKFLPNFQSFIFDEDNGTLVVEGSSDKIGGDYLVRIHPRTD